jgi:hypothetical protein
MVGKIFEERDVDADELPLENHLEAGDDDEVRTMGKGVLDPMSGTQLSNQPKDEVFCNREGEEEIGGLSNTEGDDRGQGGGVEVENRRRRNHTMPPRHGTPEKRKQIEVIALRTRGRKQGQCRPQSRGRHLHGSPVRAQTCW